MKDRDGGVSRDSASEGQRQEVLKDVIKEWKRMSV